jgi:hypothetical protein
MRSEEEMLELILNTAKTDGRIRAVMLNGSRVTQRHSVISSRILTLFIL